MSGLLSTFINARPKAQPPVALGAAWDVTASDVVRWATVLALAASALTTPGFLTVASLRALLSAMSFVGCVAVGMTFITLSGNIMSFSLGASLAASTVIFVVMLPFGVWIAAIATLLFGAALNGAQGWLIGYFRANPIIVSMAAYSLIIGTATYLTEGRGLYIEDDAADILKGNIGLLPGPLAAFLSCVILGQSILTFTHVGRAIRLSGSNARAALAAGFEPWRATCWAYAIAGAFTSLSAVFIAARSGSGDLQHGAGFEYSAISAVLVGGTLIQGGHGSVLRTLFGAFVIAVLQAILVLRGFSTEVQQLSLGAVVLLVIALQWRRGQ